MQRFEVGVVGAGYVGLVTAACLAHLGHRVTCVDRDPERVGELTEGRLPIYEPYLEHVIRESADRITFTTALAGAVRSSEVLFVAVDTPQGEDGSANLASVIAVARNLGRALASGREPGSPLMVVNKSTVPVGSGDYVSMLIEEGIAEAGGDGLAEFQVVSNPEFLREGSAVHDTFYPDRIVLGSESEKALGIIRELYRP